MPLKTKKPNQWLVHNLLKKGYCELSKEYPTTCKYFKNESLKSKSALCSSLWNSNPIPSKLF